MAMSGDQIRKDPVQPAGLTTNPTTGSLQTGPTIVNPLTGHTIANPLTGHTIANPPTGITIVNRQRDLTTATGKMRHRETVTAIRKVHPENVAPEWESVRLLRGGVRVVLSKAIAVGEAPLSNGTIKLPWARAARG